MHREHTPAVTDGADHRRRLGMVSTFPPTECGIATFAAALTAGIIASGDTVDVVRVGAAPIIEDASVLGSINGDGPGRSAAAFEVLNNADVTIVQHEYGIYPGADGAAVVDILDCLAGPTIVVAHTVLADPSPSQRSTLERVCGAADAVVVMTETARARLMTGFEVDRSKVTVITHGAATPPAGSADDPCRPSHRRPRLLTWGLLGPGKGIEWAIDAMDELSDLVPCPHYVIAGATHPKVREHSGESYRHMLRRRVSSTAVPLVSFDNTYRDLPSLNALIRSADLVVLPYDSQDQVTSGVLVDAVAAGRPVVSTAFPHANELLSSGAGIVVAQRDPSALASAIRSVLTNPPLAAAMASEARRLAPVLSWTAVARQYIMLADELLATRAAVRS